MKDSKEGLDLKRLYAVMVNKLAMILLFTTVCSVAGGMIYQIIHDRKNPDAVYRTTSEYHIIFDKSNTEVVDYYNAYTWDTILRTDVVVDLALEVLPEHVTKEMVQQIVTGEMVGDYRFLTVHFTSTDKNMTELVADAYEHAFTVFVKNIDGIVETSLWKNSEPVEIKTNLYVKNSVYLGGVLGFLLITFFLMAKYMIDDRIMVMGDVEKYFNLSVLGIETKKGNDNLQKELASNLSYTQESVDGELLQINVEQMENQYQEMRAASGVVVKVPFGKVNRTQLERYLHNIHIQKCHVVGCIIVDADDSFIKRYYTVVG